MYSMRMMITLVHDNLEDVAVLNLQQTMTSSLPCATSYVRAIFLCLLRQYRINELDFNVPASSLIHTYEILSNSLKRSSSLISFFYFCDAQYVGRTAPYFICCKIQVQISVCPFSTLHAVSSIFPDHIIYSTAMCTASYHLNSYSFTEHVNVLVIVIASLETLQYAARLLV